jgi:hypothetical protein
MSSQSYSEMQSEASYIDRIFCAYQLSQHHKTVIIEKAGKMNSSALENLAKTLCLIDKAGMIKAQVNRTAKYGPRPPRHTQCARKCIRGPKPNIDA